MTQGAAALYTEIVTSFDVATITSTATSSTLITSESVTTAFSTDEVYITVLSTEYLTSTVPTTIFETATTGTVVTDTLTEEWIYATTVHESSVTTLTSTSTDVEYTTVATTTLETVTSATAVCMPTPTQSFFIQSVNGSEETAFLTRVNGANTRSDGYSDIGFDPNLANAAIFTMDSFGALYDAQTGYGMYIYNQESMSAHAQAFILSAELATSVEATPFIACLASSPSGYYGNFYSNNGPYQYLMMCNGNLWLSTDGNPEGCPGADVELFQWLLVD